MIRGASQAVLALLLLGFGGCKDKPAEGTPGGAPPAPSALLQPAQATARAPDQYTVKLATTKGDILLDVHRDWAPLGADRFYNLVKIGFLDDVAFFRVVA